MADELLHYYERELAYLRRTGAEFGRRYPKVAGRLLLEPNKCDDPHVERLLEGFAFLAARVHLKIDDDFPEISEALLSVVYPHYVRPIPSLSMVQMHLDPDQGKLMTGLRVARGSLMYSRPVGGQPCRFQTCYDTTLWPIQVAAAKWLSPHELKPPVPMGEAVAALRLELHGLPDVSFAKLELETLRLHINAETNLTAALYELLCNNCLAVVVREVGAKPGTPPIVLPGTAVQPVGFRDDEGLLPHARRSFLGYRLLQEYFAFPEKFSFVDVAGFDRVRAAGFGQRIELIFLISAFERTDRRAILESGVNADTIRLGCTPIINLFPLTSEPVLLTQRQQEYLVVPDARRRTATSIYSVDEVVAVTPGAAEPLRFEPFYSFRHGKEDGSQLFWHARRRPTAWAREDGTDVYLSFVDDSARMVHPDADAVTARLTCYNADLPSRLPFGDARGDFEMPGGGPITRIVTLVKPTSVVQPPLGKPQLWRLISQLSLNYISLEDGGVESIQEMLRLHNVSETLSAEKQIEGVRAVRTRPMHARIESEHGITFARGHRVEVDFDEDQFAGGGVYLLASVIERCLGLYVSMNSFCVLAARSLQRKNLLREWPPRSGRKALL
jgi:type VI secretion system protein ImpG